MRKLPNAEIGVFEVQVYPFLDIKDEFMLKRLMALLQIK